MNHSLNVISMDMWHPGLMKNMITTMKNQRAVLTRLCNLTGFVSLAYIPQIDSNTMARLAFSHFFILNGLPKLVIIDGGSEFKGALIAMCDQLGVSHYVEPPEVHKAILCEHFH
jgi:hypothetical protein